MPYWVTLHPDFFTYLDAQRPPQPKTDVHKICQTQREPDG